MNKKPSLHALLGKTVTIQIDRPIGSAHPRYPLTIYSLNYGYIADLMGGDSQPQDAYLMGIRFPVTQYTGKVIAIIKRLNDREDKLVVAPEGMMFHQAEIAEAVRFQEQYYKTRIIPLYHRSCGAIIYRHDEDRIRYLLIYQRGSHTWSFPKGHMERGESEEMTARREIWEEVGMKVDFISGFRREAVYPVGAGEKTVVLYLAKDPGTAIVRSFEAVSYRWVTLAQAENLLHDSLINPLRAANEYIGQS